MIHRLALLMGGAGAASVLALAVALGGFGTPLASTLDAFAQGANKALDGGQVTPAAPTDKPAQSNNEPGDGSPRKVIDTVYVMPAPARPAVGSARPASDVSQPGATPRPARDHNGGDNTGSQAGDDQGDDSSADEDRDEDHDEDQSETSTDDQSNDGEHSDDGGQGPGDD